MIATHLLRGADPLAVLCRQQSLKEYVMCRVDDWKIDLSSRSLRGCDPHGWHYGFNFLQMPFHGRTHAMHPLPCVRRRRWIRTRVLEAWGPVTAEMQVYLVPSKLAVCPTKLGSSSNHSSPRSNSPDIEHGDSGLDAVTLRRGGSDGGTYRRHGSAESISDMLFADHALSQSMPVLAQSSTEQVSTEPCHSPEVPSFSSGLHSRAASGDTQMDMSVLSSDRLRGGEAYGSGNIDAVLTARRRTASTPAGFGRRGQGLGGDVSPASPPYPRSPVPSLNLSGIAVARRAHSQRSDCEKGRVKAKSWIFPDADVEQTSGDLLRMYSEKMYGGDS
jgi:hypothetical protein